MEYQKTTDQNALKILYQIGAAKKSTLIEEAFNTKKNNVTEKYAADRLYRMSATKMEQESLIMATPIVNKETGRKSGIIYQINENGINHIKNIDTLTTKFYISPKGSAIYRSACLTDIFFQLQKKKIVDFSQWFTMPAARQLLDISPGLDADAIIINKKLNNKIIAIHAYIHQNEQHLKQIINIATNEDSYQHIIYANDKTLRKEILQFALKGELFTPEIFVVSNVQELILAIKKKEELNQEIQDMFHCLIDTKVLIEEVNSNLLPFNHVATFQIYKNLSGFGLELVENLFALLVDAKLGNMNALYNITNFNPRLLGENNLPRSLMLLIDKETADILTESPDVVRKAVYIRAIIDNKIYQLTSVGSSIFKGRWVQCDGI